MIAIDTNVLLRYLLADEMTQFAKAEAVIKTNQPVLILDIVLVETIWTLSGKRYGYGKDDLLKVIRGLINDSVFLFEDIQVVWTALCTYDESVTIQGKKLDFADSLIVAKSHAIAQKSGIKLKAFYSFDKAVHQLAGSASP